MLSIEGEARIAFGRLCLRHQPPAISHQLNNLVGLDG